MKKRKKGFYLIFIGVILSVLILLILAFSYCTEKNEYMTVNDGKQEEIREKANTRLVHEEKNEQNTRNGNLSFYILLGTVLISSTISLFGYKQLKEI